MRGANPYVSTPNGVVSGLTCGQWVAVEGYRKPGRFVRYEANGEAFVVKPTGKGRKARVNMNAFRLACGKPLAAVISRLAVNASVVNLTVDNDLRPAVAAIFNAPVRTMLALTDQR